MRVAVVARSGLAHEVLVALRAGGGLEDAVVLDDDAGLWGSTLADVPVIGGLDVLQRLTDHQVLVCAGRGSARSDIVARLHGRGIGVDRYATFVHPTAQVPPGCVVGHGSILLAGVVLTANVRVGHHVVAMPHVTLTHDDVVDDYATLCAGVSLGGGVQVGAAAYVGMNASVREGVTVGAGSTLGMGAALVEDLAPDTTAVGVPAVPLDQRHLQEV